MSVTSLIIASLIFTGLIKNDEAPLELSRAVQQACPRVTVSCIGTDSCEPPYYFKAFVYNATSVQQLSFKWSVRNGRLQSGQGTSVIQVLGNRVRRVVHRDGFYGVQMGEARGLTATVELTGLAPACEAAVASYSLLEGPPAQPSERIGEFGFVPFSAVKPSLDKLAYRLRSDPAAVVFFRSNGKWPLAKRAIEYLVKTHHLQADRIFYEQQKGEGPLGIKLYVIPIGANPPD